MNTSETAARIPPLRELLTVLGAGMALAIWTPDPASAGTVLKISTLAPEGSGWARALREMDADLRAATDDALKLRIYPGGVQGDEDVMLRKIRIGQLQGAALGGTGVSRVCREVLALEMPFLFGGYDEIDYVLAQTEQEFKALFLDQGFVLLGWADIGFVHLLSKDPVRGTGDLHGLKIWRLQGEPITEVLFEKAGVTSVPLAIPDVLLGLQTNLVDVVYASPAAAIILQWFTRVGYYTELPINYTLGAFVVHRKYYDGLSAEHQELLTRVAAARIGEHNLRGRGDNEEALRIMRAEGLQPVVPTEADVASFRSLVEESRPELVGRAFSAPVYERILRHLGDFRGRRDGG